MSQRLKGIPAAPGVVISQAFLLKPKEEFIVPKKAIDSQQIPVEICRFEEALIKTRKEILGIQKKIAQEMGLETAAEQSPECLRCHVIRSRPHFSGQHKYTRVGISTIHRSGRAVWL